MAASSSFLATLYASRKEIRSTVRTLFDSLEQTEALPSFDVTKSVANEMFPSINEETTTWLTKAARNNPLLISLYKENISQDAYQQILNVKLHPWWCDMYDSLNSGDPNLEVQEIYF